MFVRLALALAAGSVVSWGLIAFLRLSVPILAMLVPWALAALVIAAGLAGWYWYRNRKQFSRIKKASLLDTSPRVSDK